MMGLSDKKGENLVDTILQNIEGNNTLKAETGGPQPPDKEPDNEDKNKKKGFTLRNPFKFVGDMFSRENVELAEN